MAAKQFQIIAELYETDIVDIPNAIIFYETTQNSGKKIIHLHENSNKAKKKQQSKLIFKFFK